MLEVRDKGLEVEEEREVEGSVAKAGGGLLVQHFSTAATPPPSASSRSIHNSSRQS